MTEELDATASEIAAHGREALVDRLRIAYADAAAAHADVVTMGPERIEELVQRSADRADGLQWRRALADVACSELGLSLTEALNHPAVVRAQEMVGAPSYEESLTALIGPTAARSIPVAEPARTEVAEEEEIVVPEAEEAQIAEDEALVEAEEEEEAVADEDDGSPEAEAEVAEPEAAAVAEPEDSEVAEVAEPEVAEEEAAAPEEDEAAAVAEEQLDVEAEPEAVTEAADAEDFAYGEPVAEAIAEPPPTAPPADSLLVAATHLGGVADLPTGQPGLFVRLSIDGLDIIRDRDEIVGRLGWTEIDRLEVPQPRGRLRRRGGGARLIVRTRNGDASFDIPDSSSEDLRHQVDPLVERFGQG